MSRHSLFLVAAVVLTLSSAHDALAVACTAKVVNQSAQTLVLTDDIHARPTSGWTVPGGWSEGREVKPGETFQGKYDGSASGCGATLNFRTVDSRSLRVDFSNPAHSASTWSCSPNGFLCRADGNKHGQPLKITFTITDP